MEAALIARLRAAQNVRESAGVFAGEPAIDFDERKSDDARSFPAAIQTLVSPGRNYDQDRPSATRSALMRYEIFGLSATTVKILTDAISYELEAPANFDGVRFQRGRIWAERSAGVETVGDLNIHRRILDMEITATY